MMFTLSLKNPKKTQRFNSTVYSLSQSQCFLKRRLIPYPDYLTTLSHDRRPVSRFYLQPLRKNPLSVSLHTEDEFAKETLGNTSNAHCLVVLIMQFFFSIMAASIMLYHSCRPSGPNGLHLLTKQTIHTITRTV